MSAFPLKANAIDGHARRSGKRPVVVARIQDSADDRGRIVELPGRFGWALRELVRAGERGVTVLELPAPRWSHYVFRLRRDWGVAIETAPHEPHGGAYPGTHGRYRLQCRVQIVEDGATGREVAA